MLAYFAALIIGVANAASPLRVVDGDTLAGPRLELRIVGLDAPEIFHYRCPAEKALGLKAKAAMTELVGPNHTVKVIRERDRHHHVKHDKYGRPLVKVYSDGKDVAAIMIAKGLAHAYAGTGPKQGWCDGTPTRRKEAPQ